MKKAKIKQSEDIRNFVAKYMHDAGCSTQIIEDKKSKMKRGKGKNSFNKSKIDY